ncbi:hypothetical protein GQ55_7G247300 [Panicum hallii var. hallii]|uniref:Uncharacterized protein n=1 Tax=Panicum hallii var. hallii TaxID=1504633 RepID=A0A2T7CYP3_9POAL|nr:hypothetical protein GQ55_7G247300 [Panicum hallii var. hallii]
MSTQWSELRRPLDGCFSHGARWRGPRGEDVWPATLALMLHFSRWVFIHL